MMTIGRVSRRFSRVDHCAHGHMVVATGHGVAVPANVRALVHSNEIRTTSIEVGGFPLAPASRPVRRRLKEDHRSVRGDFPIDGGRARHGRNLPVQPATARRSLSGDRGGCGACLHQHGDDIEALVPTVSFISFAAGLEAAMFLAQASQGISHYSLNHPNCDCRVTPPASTLVRDTTLRR
jgi:hypothetical protein